jgi:hypothetical protein
MLNYGALPFIVIVCAALLWLGRMRRRARGLMA